MRILSEPEALKLGVDSMAKKISSILMS